MKNTPTIVPLDKQTSQVIAVAKRNLKKGEKLDGIGGFTVYGVIEKIELATKENALPLGLAKGMVMKKDIAKGELIRWEDVEKEKESILLQLYQRENDG